MFLHVGNDVVINDRTLIGVFDLENTSVAVATKDFLAKAQKEGRVVNVTYELPRSFLVCEEMGVTTVYICQVSAATIRKRAQPEEETRELTDF